MSWRQINPQHRHLALEAGLDGIRQVASGSAGALITDTAVIASTTEVRLMRERAV